MYVLEYFTKKIDKIDKEMAEILQRDIVINMQTLAIKL